jgi:WD40 repeat protein
MLPRSASPRARPVSPAHDQARPEPGHTARVTLRPHGLMILWTVLVLAAIPLVPSREPQEPESAEGVILRGHTGQVNAVAFAPDGRTLASAGRDGIIRLWHPGTGRVRSAPRGHLAGRGDCPAPVRPPEGPGVCHRAGVLPR